MIVSQNCVMKTGDTKLLEMKSLLTDLGLVYMLKIIKIPATTRFTLNKDVHV